MLELGLYHLLTVALQTCDDQRMKIWFATRIFLPIQVVLMWVYNTEQNLSSGPCVLGIRVYFIEEIFLGLVCIIFRGFKVYQGYKVYKNFALGRQILNEQQDTPMTEMEDGANRDKMKGNDNSGGKNFRDISLSDADSEASYLSIEGYNQKIERLSFGFGSVSRSSSASNLGLNQGEL
eukprot:g1020.t1